MKLPADLDAALYCELVNRPPSTPDALRMQWGPTAQWAKLEAQRELWALAVADATLFDDEPEAGAA